MKRWQLEMANVVVSPEDARRKELRRARERARLQGQRARGKLLATHKLPVPEKEKGRSRRKRREQRAA